MQAFWAVFLRIASRGVGGEGRWEGQGGRPGEDQEDGYGFSPSWGVCLWIWGDLDIGYWMGAKRLLARGVLGQVVGGCSEMERMLGVVERGKGDGRRGVWNT